MALPHLNGSSRKSFLETEDSVTSVESESSGAGTEPSSLLASMDSCFAAFDRDG
jgi:hypothetical protein